MRWLALVLACVTLGFPVSSALAGSPASRHKPGPTFSRGVVTRLDSTGFVLKTKHGAFQVMVVAATSVTEKGKRGRVSIQPGDHVGVRGFVQGTQIRAIYVHIYPRKAKPKPYSIRGTVTQVQGNSVVVAVGATSVTIVLTAQTAVRFGSSLSTIAAVTVGARVEARVVHQGTRIVAVRIHVYHRKAGGKHVRIRGTVTSVAAGSMSVRSGSRVVTIKVTSSTRVYMGNKRSSRGVVVAGAPVTVYVCCQGATFVATSIHVHKTALVHHATTLLRGWILSLAAGTIRISTTAGPVQVAVGPATKYAVGAAKVSARSIRVGDEVSIRAARTPHGWQAVSVHVYSGSRRPRTVIGVIVSVSSTHLVVLSRGKRYTVTLSLHPPISLSGRAVASWSLLPGDHARATGRLTGPTTLSATRITVRRVAPKSHVIRGTVASVGAGTIMLVDLAGVHHRIRITPQTAILVHRHAAPRSLIFPGVHASARGVMSHGALVAAQIALTLVARSVTAHVTRVTRTYLVIQRGTTEVIRVDLPPGTSVMDGSKRVTVGIGADVAVAGYEIRTGEIRATSVRVVHLAVTLSGVAAVGSGTLTLVTSQGTRYRLRLTSSTQISSGREAITLTPSTIPDGVRIHVQGTLGTDGSVTVSQLTVRLASDTLRGTVTALAGTALTITTPTGAVAVRLSAAVTYAQGSHPLDLSGIVLGDDVTVYGYDDGPGTVLARKILVHRKLSGLDGTVASVTADGFVFTAADGPHTVILTATTVYTGLTATTITAGMTVHVTGYLRGDGSILATRVRAGKHRYATAASNW